MRDQAKRTYAIKGHEFDCCLCSRSEDGDFQSGDIVARLNRIGAVVITHYGPWGSESDAHSSMLEKAYEIAERYP